ncbi:MAG: alpha/beta hydrolase [Crocinitomicaceae bacterium]
MKKRLVKAASFLFPKQISNFAYRKLTHPQKRNLKQNEVMEMETADKEWFKFKTFDIQMYRWNAGPKTILLVHGWEGQAGNFSKIIERLLAENFSILAFDGPSHGNSKGNGATSLFEFAELVGVLVEKFKIKYIVSHSFGGVATTYSLSEKPQLKIEKYLLLTTPNKFLDRIDVVANQIGISKKVKHTLLQRLEKELDIDLFTISVAALCNKTGVKNALILHDLHDKVLSIEESRAVNDHWPICELEAIQGTGHFKILQSEKVLTRMVKFFQD